MPGSPHLRRLLPAIARSGMGAARRTAWLAAVVLALAALACAPGLAPVGPVVAEAALKGAPAGAKGAPAAAKARGRAGATRKAAPRRRLPFTRVRQVRSDLRRQGLKRPTLTLKSTFIRRAQAASLVLPFTIRLRPPYEGGPGNDVLQLSWDHGAVPWPLDGTTDPGVPATTNLDGGLSYEWDYGADVTGYAMAGTVETVLGGGISMTAAGFPIAVPDGGPCTTARSVTATGMALTSAGARFGTVNPFSGEVNGTINLRTAIRTEVVRCDGSTVSAVAPTTLADPPLPVAFSGHFTVSPGISADGRIRLGILRVDDVALPQRTTFGLVHACADPAAPDGCGRRAFPVRTKLLGLTAEVLAGDVMPPAPAIPNRPPPSTTTPPSTTPPSTTPPDEPGTPPDPLTDPPPDPATDPAAAILGP